MILALNYPVYSLSPDNLTGDNLTIQAISDMVGGTTDVTVSEGDLVGTVTLDPNNMAHLVIYEVYSGAPWVEAAKQPEPGDIVVSIATDVPYLIGNSAIVNENESLSPVNFGFISAAFEMNQPDPCSCQPKNAATWMAGVYDLTPDITVASCDTSEGDVTIKLPDGDAGRVVFVSNRNGAGTVHLVSESNPGSIHPVSPVGLGPGGRCVIASFGGGWDVKL